MAARAGAPTDAPVKGVTLHPHHDGDHRLHRSIVNGHREQGPLALLDAGKLLQQFALLDGQLVQAVRDGLGLGLLLFQQFADATFGNDRPDPVRENLKNVVIARLVRRFALEPENPQHSELGALVPDRGRDEVMDSPVDRVAHLVFEIVGPIRIFDARPSSSHPRTAGAPARTERAPRTGSSRHSATRAAIPVMSSPGETILVSTDRPSGASTRSTVQSPNAAVTTSAMVCITCPVSWVGMVSASLICRISLVRPCAAVAFAVSACTASVTSASVKMARMSVPSASTAASIAPAIWRSTPLFPCISRYCTVDRPAHREDAAIVRPRSLPILGNDEQVHRSQCLLRVRDTQQVEHVLPEDPPLGDGIRARAQSAQLVHLFEHLAPDPNGRDILELQDAEDLAAFGGDRSDRHPVGRRIDRASYSKTDG